MHERIPEVRSANNPALKHMFALESSVASGPLPSRLLHLIKLRVSQINGCAFCVNKHATEARQDGETEERLLNITTWRETPFFSETERAALELAEAATRISDNPHGVPEDVWQQAREQFDNQELSTLVMAIAAINTWNRINVINRTPPENHTP